MDEKIKLLAHGLGEHRIKFKEQLTYHTASNLQASADYFYIATSKKELTEVLDATLDLRIPFIILGSGTKMLAANIKSDHLIIKNRTNNLKIGAIKGKVGSSGIGVEEAMVEVDSGVSLIKLNQFLEEQRLQKITSLMFAGATIGGSIFTEVSLRDKVEQLTVWEQGDIFTTRLDELKSEQVVLSIILRIKA